MIVPFINRGDPESTWLPAFFAGLHTMLFCCFFIRKGEPVVHHYIRT